MSITAMSEYIGVPRDTVDHYNGNVEIFVVWNKHLMYAAPFAFCLPPTTMFRDFVTTMLTMVIKDHPDTPKIDWSRVQWEKSCSPWVPDFDKSLIENNISHKDSLRMTTPGLDGYRGLGI